MKPHIPKHLSVAVEGLGTITSVSVHKHFNGYYTEFVCGTPIASPAKIYVMENGIIKSIVKLGPTASSLFQQGQLVQLEIK